MKVDSSTVGPVARNVSFRSLMQLQVSSALWGAVVGAAICLSGCGYERLSLTDVAMPIAETGEAKVERATPTTVVDVISRGVERADTGWDGEQDFGAMVANDETNKVWDEKSLGAFSDAPQNFGALVSNTAVLNDLDGKRDVFITRDGANMVWFMQ